MKRPSAWVVVVGVVLVCALLACKRKAADNGSGSSAGGSLSARAAKLKPEVEKRLQQLAALAPKVKAEAAVSRDAPVNTKPAKGSYVVIGEHWLTDPNYSESGDELNFEDTTLGLCKHGLEDEPDDEDDVKYLEQCVALKTAAVIRPQSYTPPKIDMAKETYKSGALKADVFVYDLETAKLLGSYMIIIGNDPELTLPGKEQTEADWMSMARVDLSQNAISKVEQQFE